MRNENSKGNEVRLERGREGEQPGRTTEISFSWEKPLKTLMPITI